MPTSRRCPSSSHVRPSFVTALVLRWKGEAHLTTWWSAIKVNANAPPGSTEPQSGARPRSKVRVLSEGRSGFVERVLGCAVPKSLAD